MTVAGYVGWWRLLLPGSRKLAAPRCSHPSWRPLERTVYQCSRCGLKVRKVPKAPSKPRL